MNQAAQDLLQELMSIRNELEQSIQNPSSPPLIRRYKEEELKDIQEAIHKIQSGHFGYCEWSGEIMPYDLLQMVPTVKSYKDIEEIRKYFCKSLF